MRCQSSRSRTSGRRRRARCRSAKCAATSSTRSAGRPASSRLNSASLARSAAVPANSAARTILGRVARTAKATGPGPRTLKQERAARCPRVIVPSKSKAATVGRGSPGPPGSDGLTGVRPPRPAPSAKRRAPPSVSPLAMTARAPAGLVHRRLLLGHPPLLEGREPVAAQADLGERGQLPGERHGVFQRRTRGGEPVDQADGQGLGTGHAPAGQDEVHGPGVPDQAGEAHRPQVAQGHPEPPAVDAEHGVLGCHPQVAPQGQLQATGHGVPLDGGDHRLGQGHAGGAHRARPGVGNRAAVAVRQRLEVGPGAEGTAGAGRARPRGPNRPSRTAEGLAQPVGGRAVDGVADLGPVDDHHGDRAVALDVDAAFLTHGGRRAPWRDCRAPARRPRSEQS